MIGAPTPRSLAHPPGGFLIQAPPPRRDRCTWSVPLSPLCSLWWIWHLTSRGAVCFFPSSFLRLPFPILFPFPGATCAVTCVTASGGVCTTGTTPINEAIAPGSSGWSCSTGTLTGNSACNSNGNAVEVTCTGLDGVFACYGPHPVVKSTRK